MSIFEIRSTARDLLSAYWKEAVQVTMVFYGLAAILLWLLKDHPYLPLGVLLLMGTLAIAAKQFFLLLARENDVSFRDALDGLKHCESGFFSSIQVTVSTIFWLALFIVPGVVKAYSYRMTQRVLVDNPRLSVGEAIKESKLIMQGNRFELFKLDLSFSLWFILSMASLGIGFLFLIPYMETSYALFYNDIARITNAGIDRSYETYNYTRAI